MDGIIFDVDGTLWDATDKVAASWDKVIKENSDAEVHVDGACLRRLFGRTMDVIFNTLLPSLTQEEKDNLATLCYENELKVLENEPCELYPGVLETLKKLSKKTKLFIVSNCQCGYIDVMLKTTGLDAYIEDYLCYGNTLVTKDKTIHIIMERNQLEDVVYVGDTQGDFDACKDAGIPFIFVEYGYGKAPAAQTKIKKIEELLPMF